MSVIVEGFVFFVRSSCYAQPEGEIAPCEPYQMARVDAVILDGVRYTPDPWKLDGGRLPRPLPNGSERFMDAAEYLLHPGRDGVLAVVSAAP